MDRFVEAVAKIRVVDRLDESVQICPLQSAVSKQKMPGVIEKGVKEGAKRLLMEGS